MLPQRDLTLEISTASRATHVYSLGKCIAGTLTSTYITGTFALRNHVWDADKQDKNMTGTRSSAEQRLPSHHDGVANGLSIKGAAARRQQALEHASSKETAATSVDQGNALLATSMESTERTKEKDEEIITAINNPSVNAEIASVGKHLTTTAPTLDHYPLPHYHPDETGAQSGTSRTSVSDMPPLQSAGFRRTASGEGKSLLHIPLHYVQSL